MSENYYMLGYGFDATGKYVHPAWVRNKIIDIDRYEAGSEGSASLFKVLSGSPEINILGTKKECLMDLASLAGFDKSKINQHKNLFKATFESAFVNDTSYPNLDYSYSGYSSVSAIYLARFIYKSEYMNKSLTEEFKSDLQSLSADKIITKYGTHLLTEVYVGMRIDYLYRANSSDWDILNRWSGYNAFYYLKILTSGLTVYKPDIENPQKENIYIEIVDGRQAEPNSWMIDITNYEGTPVTFEGWGKISDTDLALVNFTDKALIPIYELVPDMTKKEELRKAYEKYLNE